MSDDQTRVNRPKLPDGSAVSLKAALIAVLVLLFCIPIELIKGIVNERQCAMESARDEIVEKAGGACTLGAVYLSVPVAYTELDSDDEGKPLAKRVEKEMLFMPREIDMKADTQAETRKRGIYQVPAYAAEVTIRASFACGEADTELAEPEADWGRAHLVMELDDPRSIAELPTLENGGKSQAMRAGKASLGFLRRALSAPIAFSPARAGAERTAEAVLRLKLNGAQSLMFLPSGDSTTASLTGNWKSPSFRGYRLPNDRAVASSGFSATWYADGSSRPFPAALDPSKADMEQARAYLFGADFDIPADVYLQTHRALRYALLFIIIPFVALFLFETIIKRKIHPLQYLLIGLADSVFYLLLLSLSEHIAFMAAFLVASGSVTVLLTLYAASILGEPKRSFLILPVLVAQYAYLYCALVSQDYALLIGSVGLFALIAATMIGTRKLDWYSGAAARKARRTESLSSDPDSGR